VWTIGEFAFREFSVYLEKINPQHMSEFYASYFNAAGIYLRGRKDKPIYDWLYELGGDGLAPFMIYYSGEFWASEVKLLINFQFSSTRPTEQAQFEAGPPLQVTKYGKPLQNRAQVVTQSPPKVTASWTECTNHLEQYVSRVPTTRQTRKVQV
jgi:hypothetical protein